ncbi:MAG: UbiA family prenyltransferase [Candidatus Electrothrix aestuarii]|uniref:heme o synthase n=1 Tax=Candidatus Electrothrix aestuarii TaxID=3062594 RepID=A0AAU8M1D7_9BACT|nr:UbiA family prenyltransferase [Candidatus Electrothrix aestuarii]
MKKSSREGVAGEVPILPAFAGQLSDRVQLAKLVLCLQVAFSTLFGFLYTAQAFSFQAVWVALAVLVLACGAASLNSYQERGRDALMQRTRNRPLVRKKLSPQHALIQALSLIALGLFLLFQFANLESLFAGIAAVLLYNVVYTNMKGVTLYALLPGAICGALPPYIGALAVEADEALLRTVLPALLLFFWQVPHFFLVLLNHKQDYASGAVPNLLQRLSEPALQRVFLPWIAALAMVMLLFTVMPSSLDAIARLLVAANAVALLGVFGFQLIYRKEPAYGFLFQYLNFSLLFVMLVGCWGGVGS